ncbi:MAG: type III secretion system chaperone [Candidatus Methylomirabilales bacterium]
MGANPAGKTGGPRPAALEERIMGKRWLISIIVGLGVAGCAGTANTALPPSRVSSAEAPRGEAAMDLSRLGRILKASVPEVNGRDGFWEMRIEGVNVTVIADETHNRMRVIAPAADAVQVNPAILGRMMEANFTSALDVRYGIFKGVVWAAFLHPLDSLTARELRSALNQVVTLVKTTGSTYSSSGLTFGGSEY